MHFLADWIFSVRRFRDCFDAGAKKMLYAIGFSPVPARKFVNESGITEMFRREVLKHEHTGKRMTSGAMVTPFAAPPESASVFRKYTKSGNKS